MNQESNNATRTNKELRLFLQIYIADLKFYKKQQWHILYLSIIAFAAIINIIKGFKNEINANPKLLVSLFVITFFIFMISLYHIYSYYDAIIDCRNRKLEVSKTFTRKTRRLSGITDEKETQSNKRDLDTSGIFTIIILFGTMISIAILMIEIPLCLTTFIALVVAFTVFFYLQYL